MRRDNAILEAIEEPALIVERGHVASANGAAITLFGAQSIGRDVRLVIRHPLALDSILSGEEGELELFGIGSPDRPWRIRTRPLAKDVTLVRLSDRSDLRAAERMRTDFVANASHELRTPLATIIGYAETLAEAAPIPDELRGRFGKTIETEARRMLRIVEDLMSLSRIEADRYRTPGDQVDLGEVVRLAIDHAGEAAIRKGCEVTADIAGDLPKITGDHGQLLQLADNLIGNAIRYGCNDRARTVEAIVGQEQRWVLLQVKDRGDGIGHDHLPRLTERFYRVDPARSRESGGTGLGLAIVKHIVERHRGTLDIRSEPGHGTTVTVSLPIA